MNKYYGKLNKVNGGFKIDSLRNIFESNEEIKIEMSPRTGKKAMQEHLSLYPKLMKKEDK